MSDWVIYPWNVLPLITAGLFLLLFGYMLMIPNKSGASKILVAWVFVGLVGQLSSTLQIISGNSQWENVLFSQEVWSGIVNMTNVVGPSLLLVFCYQVGRVRFESEQKKVIRFVAPIALALIIIPYFVDWDEWVWVFAGFGMILMLWNGAVLIRKWFASKNRQDESATSYLAYAAVFCWPLLLLPLALLFFFIDAVVYMEYLTEIAQVAGPIMVGLLFLQFAPEATSLGSKFVGVAFLAVIVMTQFYTIPINSNHELKFVYAPTLEPESITLTPTESGGYIAEGRVPVFFDLVGDTLAAEDDFWFATKPDFPVLFYGSEVDSLYVSANGKFHFEANPDSIIWHTNLERQPLASMAVFDIDFDPSESGHVLFHSSEDSVVVTWVDVPLLHDDSDNTGSFPVDKRLMNAQMVLRRDGSVLMNRGSIPFLPLNWSIGITPGLTILEQQGFEPDTSAWRGSRGGLIPTQFPLGIGNNEIVYYSERNMLKYQAWARQASFELLRNALMIALLILFLVPLYYRFSIRKRLSMLMGGLDRVNAGDLDHDIRVFSQDEVGQLTNSFNLMSGSLRTYNNEMEGLVEERTAELKATQAQLIEQEKLASLGSLTAGIAHEIKNPLNFVNNFAEVGGELADELREAIVAGKNEEAQSILDELQANSEQITKHGRRADDIVKSMMQHARGGVSEREEIAVNAFLEEYANLAWHGMRAKDHGFQAELKRDFSADVGAVTAMPQELGRVILNLLNNAFDAVRSTAAAEVSIGTRAAQDSVEIFVSDNGPGIPEDIREKIFEPFFTTKATGEGTGLGLSLSYDIITKGHGGTMTVGKSMNGGAEFTLTIPVS